LPPCQPKAGINTDWSGNKCAALQEGPSLFELPPLRPKVSNTQHPAKAGSGELDASNNSDAVPMPEPEASKTQQPAPQLIAPPPKATEQPLPQATEQPAPQVKPDVGTVGQQQARGHSHPPSMFSNIEFDLAIALCLALALIVIRRIVLNFFDPFGGSSGVDRDDAE
jgi:hypothetical protein